MKLFDIGFFQRILPIALPLALRHLLSSALSLVDTMMIGRVHEQAIGAVDLANQLTFLFFISMIGVTSGSSIFIAQYFGAKNYDGIKKTLCFTLQISLLLGGLATLFTSFFSESVLLFYTNEPYMVREGSRYLSLIAPTFILSAVSLSYGTAYQSIKQAKLPVIISVGALALNTLLNYILIYGNFGFPELAVSGAAIATLISRFVEVLLFIFVLKKSSVLNFPLGRFFSFDIEFAKKILRTSSPVFINQFMWAAGTTLYKKVYGSMGGAVPTAISIAERSVDIAMVFFYGTATASAIAIGSSLGENRRDVAFDDGRRVLFWAPLSALVVSILFILVHSYIPGIYGVTGDVADLSRRVLISFALVLPFKVYNMHMVDGVLRSGGDTAFGMWLDILGVWGIGVPTAFIGAFIFNLPIEILYIIIASEELVKATVGTFRVNSGRWIRSLV